MKFPSSRFVLPTLSLLACLVAQSQAATFTWSGATDTAFATGGNWVGGVAPATSITTDIALFTGVPTANQPFVAAARSINGVRMNTASGGWNLGGDTSFALTIGAGGISTAGQTSGTNTISARLALGNSQTWEVGTGGTLIFTGALVTGGGNISIGTVGNAGTVVLNPNATSYIGSGATLSLNYGQLHINNNFALGAANSNFAINGGSIDNSSGASITMARVYNYTWNSDFTFIGSNAFGLGTGAVSLGTAAGTSRTVTVNSNNLTVGGVISNGSTANSLIKAGSGTLTLTGANSFTGTLAVQSGAVSVADLTNASTAGALGNSANAVVLGNGGSAGTLVYTGTTVSSNKAFNIASSGTGAIAVSAAATNATLTGLISGSGAFQKLGTGTLSLANGSNSYSGGTLVSGGNLNFVSGALGSGNILFTSGTLQYATGNTQDISSRFANSTGAMVIDTNGNSVIFNSSISSSNAGGLIKVGTGTLTLNAANSYLGNTTIGGANSAVYIGNAGAFSSGNLIIDGGTGVIAATTDLTGVNKINNNISMLSNLSNTTTASSLEYGGNVDFNGTLRQITNNSSLSTTTFSGVISNDGGSGGRFITTGNIALTGINTYTGATEFRGDRALVVSQIGNGGVAGNLGAGTVLRFGSTNSATKSYLRYTGSGETTNRSLELNGTVGDVTIEQGGTGLLRFSGGITTTGTGSKTLFLTGTTSGSGQLDGNLADNATVGVVSLTKTGSGTWNLTGANTYTGATTVSAGTLLINGSSVSSVSVASGGTLGGSGSITGSVNVAAGGFLAPGNSPGILSTGNLTLAGTLSAQLGKAAPTGQPIAGTDYDQVNVTGSVNLTGGDLTLSILSGIQTNDLYFIVLNDSNDAVTGIFATLNNVATDLSQGALFSSGGQQFQISYTADSVGGTFTGGNDVALLAVPEPSTWALLGLGFGALVWRSGLRRRKL